MSLIVRVLLFSCAATFAMGQGNVNLCMQLCFTSFSGESY